jgi:hypothetical protein
MTLVLTGSVALTPSYSITPEEEDPKAPYATPTLLVTSVFHAMSAFYTYTWFVSDGQMTFALAMVGNAVLAFAGLWCLLFAKDGGRISKRTGADKRVSGWPFENKEAEKRKKGKGKAL